MYNVILFTDLTDNTDVGLPHGAYKVANSIRKQGYSCLVVNHLSNFSLEEIKELADLSAGANTVLVGFSTTFFNKFIESDPSKPTPKLVPIPLGTTLPQGKDFENQFIKIFRDKNPNIKFSAGGTKVYEQYQNKNIDYVCLGYSELSMVNLVDHLAKGVELKNSYKNLYGITVIDDKYANGYKFASDPMVWQLTDVVNYRVMPIEISRGCKFKCKFCSFPMNGKKTVDYIKHSDLLYQELKDNYEKFGVRTYTIIDETFNDDIGKLQSIRDVVQRLNFQPIFWCFARLDLICTHPETLEMLYDIGVRAMYFGIETFDSRAGRNVGKGYKSNKQIDMIKHIKSTYPDIALHGGFIAGLPGETKDNMFYTYQLILSGEVPLDSWNINGLKIVKSYRSAFNSEIDENFESMGFVDLKTDHPDSVFINWKNDQYTSMEIDKLAWEYTQMSYSSDRFHVSGGTALSLANYDGNDYMQLLATPSKNINYNDIEYNVRPKFVQQYKDRLFKLVIQEINKFTV